MRLVVVWVVASVFVAYLVSSWFSCNEWSVLPMQSLLMMGYFAVIDAAIPRARLVVGVLARV